MVYVNNVQSLWMDGYTTTLLVLALSYSMPYSMPC